MLLVKRCRMASATHCRRYGNCCLSRRRCPWLIREVEEIKQIRLRGITFGQRRQVEPRLKKTDDGSVVHGGVSNIVLPGKGRNDHVGHTKPDLSRKTKLRGCI